MNEVSYIVDTTLQLQECFGIRILMTNLRSPLMKIISTPLHRDHQIKSPLQSFDAGHTYYSLLIIPPVTTYINVLYFGCALLTIPPVTTYDNVLLRLRYHK